MTVQEDAERVREALEAFHLQADCRAPYGACTCTALPALDRLVALLNTQTEAIRECRAAMLAERVDMLWVNGGLWIDEFGAALAVSSSPEQETA